MTTNAAIVDLRSDTVTRPTAAMWDAMRSAPLGDDVLGDEPTVAKLEQAIAKRTGKEAAVYVPSGTMANQLAIRVACGPGDEIIAHEESHIIHYETGAPAALSGAMVRTVRGDGGLFDAVKNRLVVFIDQDHHPLTAGAGDVGDQGFEATAVIDKLRLEVIFLLQCGELLVQALVQVFHRPQHPSAKTEAQHRVFDRPVPAVFCREPLEQGLRALKQLFQGVKKQALAKTPWAEQKIMRTLLHQVYRQTALVHVVIAFFTNNAKT